MVLLTTKFYPPPSRPNLVPRPHLLARLDEGLRVGRKLTLVSAPAGFGKTTLLSEWLRQGRRLAAWLSLDEGDNDPVRFMAYLVAALGQMDAALQSLSALSPPLSSPSAPPTGGVFASLEPVLTALINSMGSLPAAFTLVLDDYHLLHNTLVHQALDFVLAHQPPTMHLAIGTRQDPPLPLPRLRARGRVTELRERDLRFTRDEAAAFLDQEVGRLSPQAIALLETRTEGWVAGLQLASLALQGVLATQADDPASAEAFVAAFAGDDRYVMDYLVAEVLQRQPGEIQRFLLHTSMLNQLCAPLCDALLVDLDVGESSQAVLEGLDAANLFLVPLDNRRQWYRYHRLFADLLRYRLRHQHPKRLEALHRRASQWYEASGDADEAVYHALAAADFELVAHLAEQYGVRMVGGSRLVTYLAWLRQIPDEIIYPRPYLCACCGWAFVLTGDVKNAERYVAAGEKALAGFERLYVAPEGRYVGWDEVRGHLTAIRAYCARVRGDLAEVLALSPQALQQLPADAFIVRCVVALNLALLYWDQGEIEAALDAAVQAFEAAEKSGENVYVAIAALSLQGNILGLRGQLDEATNLCRQAIELGERAGQLYPIPATSMGHWGLALVHYERFELAAAVEHLEKALDLSQQVGNSEAAAGVYLSFARVALLAGDSAEAEARLEQVAEHLRICPSPHQHTGWLALRGELYLAKGDLDAAAQCVADCDWRLENLLAGPCQEFLSELVLLPRVLLARGQSDAALEALDQLAAAAQANQHHAVLLDVLVLQALAQHRKGNGPQALAHLADALTRAAPQGYVRPFVAAGLPLVELLRCAAATGVEPLYVRRLLDALGEPEPQPLMEPLSERELQVLRLVSAGLSNREIAQELFVAVSTVKTHINHIYNKLDVKSRTQAVARANQLGLL